ncbi:MAG: ribosome hibernation-promoting factor, HPF/YfiA family [Rubricoccaceae bacterium]
MQTRITARQCDAPEPLRLHIDTSIRSLGRFYDGIHDAHVILATAPAQSKTAEVAIRVSRSTLTARDEASTHEAAVDACVRQLRRQVLRYKDKRRTRR